MATYIYTRAFTWVFSRLSKHMVVYCLFVYVFIVVVLACTLLSIGLFTCVSECRYLYWFTYLRKLIYLCIYVRSCVYLIIDLSMLCLCIYLFIYMSSLTARHAPPLPPQRWPQCASTAWTIPQDTLPSNCFGQKLPEWAAARAPYPYPAARPRSYNSWYLQTAETRRDELPPQTYQLPPQTCWREAPAACTPCGGWTKTQLAKRIF